MSRLPEAPPDAVAVEFEVPFHDVDFLQVVWHGHYCKYLELARTALLRSREVDAPQMFALGYRFYVSETHLRHLAPLRYGEKARAAAWVLDADNRIRIGCEVTSLDTGRRVAEGLTVLVTCTADGDLCFETPEPIYARLVGTAGDREVRS